MSSLQEIDTKNMKSMIEGFPLLLRAFPLDEGVQTRAAEIREMGIRGICTIGMGGSSIAGEMCRGLFEDQAHVPVFSIRDYNLPAFVKDNWVVIAVSYSGNTEETLSAFDIASSRGCKIIAITTGGELGEKSKSFPCHYLYPKFQPRAALPLIISAVLPTVEILLGLPHQNLIEVSLKLDNHCANWGSSIQTPRKLAETIHGTIPVFIGWRHLIPVAYRAKCQINENAKSLGMFLEIPESNHNEIEATLVCSKHSIKPIFLRSQWESKRVSKRFEVTSDIYSSNECVSEHLNLQCESKLEEILALTHYLDMVSVELAELQKVNPVSVERISQLKRNLSE